MELLSNPLTERLVLCDIVVISRVVEDYDGRLIACKEAGSISNQLAGNSEGCDELYLRKEAW